MSKQVASIRKLDKLHRVVVPAEIVRALDWKWGDEIKAALSGDSVMLEKWGDEKKGHKEIAEGLKSFVDSLPEEQRLLIDDAIKVLEQ